MNWLILALIAAAVVVLAITVWVMAKRASRKGELDGVDREPFRPRDGRGSDHQP